MSSFHEVRFPTDISYGAVGGPGFMTELLELRSGAEQRNISWTRARGAWDVAKGLRNQDDLDAVLAFFYARNGRGFGFRYKDWSDFKVASPQVITQTNGTWQLYKLYSSGGFTYTRFLTKPVSGTAQVYDGVTLLIEGTDYTIDYTTGIITFLSGPAGAVSIACEFDVPVRFDTDQLQINLESYNFSVWGQIPIKEIKV